MTAATTLTPTAFLLARLADDEAAALAIHAGRCETPAYTVPDSMGRPMSPVCGCDWHVARVLAQIAALRAVVALHTPGTWVAVVEEGMTFDASECPTCWVVLDEDGGPLLPGRVVDEEVVSVPYPCPTLRHLASIFADHADFAPAWLAS